MARLADSFGAGRLIRRTVGAVGLVLGLSATFVQAETLADAMANAYRNSGLLEQNRALLRAADEDVAAAAALLKPIINYSAAMRRTMGDQRSRLSDGTRVVTGLESSYFEARLEASLLLYDSGASELNVEAFPEAFNTYDSLGEAYMTAGRTADAIANYQRSLDLNPNNTNAAAMLSRLRQE